MKSMASAYATLCARPSTLLAALCLVVLLSSTAHAAPYTASTAVQLAKLSALSYCPAADVRAWTCPDCKASGLTLRDTVVGEDAGSHLQRILQRKLIPTVLNTANTILQSLKGVMRAVARKPDTLELIDAAHLRALSGGDDVRAMVLDNAKDTVYVVFKGTENLNVDQWLMNFKADAIPVPEVCKDCKVHNGFWQLHTATRDDVFRKFQTAYNQLAQRATVFDRATQKAKPMPVNVFVAGHSLGGPLAALFALYLRQHNVDSVTVYTYGCPRFGNQQLVDTYSKLLPDSWRVVHDMDTVTQIPPEWMGYRHISTLVLCPVKGAVCKVMPGVENPKIRSTSTALHGTYLDISWLRYVSLGSREACKTPAAAAATTAAAAGGDPSTE